MNIPGDARPQRNPVSEAAGFALVHAGRLPHDGAPVRQARGFCPNQVRIV